VFVVLFEVQPKKAQWDRYLERAAMLRPELEQIRGFIDNERYASERTDGRLLSLSTWASEKALVRWRTQALHRDVQEQGRFEVFDDYHLRVGEVATDSEHPDLPQTRFDVTETGSAAAATVAEVAPGVAGPTAPESSDLVDAEWYTAINTEGRRLLLASWRDADAAADWVATQTAEARYRQIRVVRDYGMRDRAEAPQYYAEVEDRSKIA
jgi:heme-degrading monooxygenase HmoA